MKKTPNPVDRHVGARVRARRIHLGLSQEKLGDALGITFQQVQKYEKGSNRMGASRLQLASQVLGVTVNYFFEGSPTGLEDSGGFSEPQGSAYVAPPSPDAVRQAEGAALLAAFSRVRDPGQRAAVVALIETMTRGQKS